MRVTREAIDPACSNHTTTQPHPHSPTCAGRATLPPASARPLPRRRSRSGAKCRYRRSLRLARTVAGRDRAGDAERRDDAERPLRHRVGDGEVVDPLLGHQLARVLQRNVGRDRDEWRHSTVAGGAGVHVEPGGGDGSRSETTAHSWRSPSSSSWCSKTNTEWTLNVDIIRATTRSGVSGGQLITPGLIASPTVAASKGTGRCCSICVTFAMYRCSRAGRSAASARPPIPAAANYGSIGAGRPAACARRATPSPRRRRRPPPRPPGRSTG